MRICTEDKKQKLKPKKWKHVLFYYHLSSQKLKNQFIIQHFVFLSLIFFLTKILLSLIESHSRTEKIRLVWLGLRHINHCWLFNGKSSLDIYIKYIGFDSVGFYGISTIIGYLMPNPLTRHAGHCWRSRDELIRDVLLWTPTHGRAKAGRPARTYIQQLCEDTGRCPEDLPRAMNDREEWRERVRDICATSAIWWWWNI